MHRILSCRTLTQRQKLESEYGTRFTVLSTLPYFDAVRMTVVDPMHNLFLGTSKKMLKIWKSQELLTKANIVEVQSRLDKCSCPNDVGRLPSKLHDVSMDVLTADELKNWTILFSLFALKGLLPQKHYDCWKTFVLASYYMCNRALSATDLPVIDHLLLKFCREFELLYGSDLVTPNMHLHGHLLECLKDFGPVYNFWLFSFERYNGILGSRPTNKKDIEVQIMSRFSRDQCALNIPFPHRHQQQFEEVMRLMEINNQQRGEIGTPHQNINLVSLSSRCTDYTKVKWYSTEGIVTSSIMKVHLLSETHYRCISGMYSDIYSDYDIEAISRSCWKFSDVSFECVTYGSYDSRSFQSSYVLSYWCGVGGSIQSHESMYIQPRPGRIMFFVKHSITVKGRIYEHYLAFVEWFLHAPTTLQSIYPKPIQVFDGSFFEPNASASFIPIQRLKCKFVHARETFQSKDCLVVMPRDRFLNI